MDLPPLSALRVFEVVSRHASIGRAAEELKIDRTAVSRHVKALQTSLNTVLLKTTQNGIVLTEEGRHYAASTRRALIDISIATAELNRTRLSGKLNIWSISGFAALFLASRLAEFEQLHPHIDVSLRPIDEDPSFLAHEADVQIRGGVSAAANVRQIKLCDAVCRPVASPDWLARNPCPTSLSDLLSNRLINYQDDSLKQWFTDRGMRGKVEISGPKMWTAHLALEAAKAGQGIALASELIIEPYLVEGSLQVIDIDHPYVQPEPYMFVTRDDLWNDPAIKSFRNWLAEVLLKHKHKQIHIANAEPYSAKSL